MTTKNVIAYIDGFNVYHGVRAKGWRDLMWVSYPTLMKQFLLADQTLAGVVLFTALRRGRPESVGRQHAFLAAVEESGVEVIRGHFDVQRVPCEKCGAMTRVPREKRSDVSLASRMVSDASQHRFDTAFLVSGDVDFVGAVEHVQDLSRQVKSLRPPGRRLDEIATAADYVKDINRRHFRRAQMALTVSTSSSGEVRCPFRWLTLEQKVDRLTQPHRRRIERLRDELHVTDRDVLHHLADKLAIEQRIITPMGDDRRTDL